MNNLKIKKFKTPKQAIKFGKTLSQTFKLHFQPVWVSLEIAYKVEKKQHQKMLTFFIFLTAVKNMSLFLNSDKQKAFVACMTVVF